jgi:hypothetical protein
MVRVDMALVSYFFGSQDQLFAAAIDLPAIAGRLGDLLGDRQPKLGERIVCASRRRQAASALCLASATDVPQPSWVCVNEHAPDPVVGDGKKNRGIWSPVPKHDNRRLPVELAFSGHQACRSLWRHSRDERGHFGGANDGAG